MRDGQVDVTTAEATKTPARTRLDRDAGPDLLHLVPSLIGVEVDDDRPGLAHIDPDVTRVGHDLDHRVLRHFEDELLATHVRNVSVILRLVLRRPDARESDLTT